MRRKVVRTASQTGSLEDLTSSLFKPTPPVPPEEPREPPYELSNWRIAGPVVASAGAAGYLTHLSTHHLLGWGGGIVGGVVSLLPAVAAGGLAGALVAGVTDSDGLALLAGLGAGGTVLTLGVIHGIHGTWQIPLTIGGAILGGVVGGVLGTLHKEHAESKIWERYHARLDKYRTDQRLYEAQNERYEKDLKRWQNRVTERELGAVQESASLVVINGVPLKKKKTKQAPR